MITAWCTQHRGVMRIAFFDPPPKHFNNPCPRCHKPLVQNPPRNPHDHTPWFSPGVRAFREPITGTAATTTATYKMDNVHTTCPDNAICTHGCREWMDRCWRVVNGYVPTAEPKMAPRCEDCEVKMCDEHTEAVSPAPRRICSCCSHFSVRPDYTDLCNWCVDCPINYCDVPKKYLK